MKLANIFLVFELFSFGTINFARTTMHMHRVDAACAGEMHAGDWNVQSLQSLEGSIKDVVVDSTCMRGIDFLTLQVTVGQQDHFVRLGPTTYINSRNLGIALGESIRIKGIMKEGAEGSYLVASEVTIKGKTIKIRDEHGRPLWAKRTKPEVS